jgi:hypothetical protein
VAAVRLCKVANFIASDHSPAAVAAMAVSHESCEPHSRAHSKNSEPL